jgi:light-regulated signal transduction histidine kinase (bacteriophytochrome)
VSPVARIDAIISRIDECELASYHQSSWIQAHGLLLAVDPASLRVIRISANAGSILGTKNDHLLGTTVPELLTLRSAAEVLDLVRGMQTGRESSARPSLSLDIAGTRGFSALAFLYRSDNLICIEIEPPAFATTSDNISDLLSRSFNVADRLAQSDVTGDRLAEMLCEALQAITGYDRIYFCRFDPIGHGHVLAESNNGVLPSLMDHHFPATDIPQAARRFMLVNPFRLIPDVEAADVAVIGGDGCELDLTRGTCRAIAKSHLRYLRNMRVSASLSFSVISGGRLEALFGGHHHAARHVSYHEMAACWHLVRLVNARLDAIKTREHGSVMAHSMQMLEDMAARFGRADCDFASFVVANHQVFCDLMDADDVIGRIGQRTCLGRLLPAHLAGELLDFLLRKIATTAGAFQTDCLSTEDSRFAHLCPAVAGALAISLDLDGSDIIVWLRSETVVKQTWAGDPNQPVRVDDEGTIGPRNSFLAYVRETKGISRPWSSNAAGLAHQMRNTFSQVLARYYEAGMRKAAEQANALKSDFIANISHELRSPMHAIIGFSEALAQDNEGMEQAKRRRFLETILSSSRRLMGLIDDLLDVSRLQAGKMTFNLSVGNLAPVIERAVGGVDSLARQQEIDITIQDRAPGVQIKLDAVRIEQVMINLLSNAIKFSPPGSRVIVSLHATQRPPALVVEVADQGVGIPPDELEMIFDKFKQSSRTRTGAGGTGLGLAICREIIHAHTGRIWAANNLCGASMFIEFPLETHHEAD